MMLVPTHPATFAPPAADLAVSGTRPSCAVAPRPGRIGRGKGLGNPLGTGRIHQIRGRGQDGRYEREQRGRAVACA